MNQAMQNAIATLEDRRRREGIRQGSGPKTIGQIHTNRPDKESAPAPAPAVSSAPIAADQDIIDAGGATLRQLVTSHMNATQRQKFEHVLAMVREWRNLYPDQLGRMFVLSSPQLGIGKSHIARAVFDSFGYLVDDGAGHQLIDHFGEFYEARQLMGLPEEAILRRHRVLVLDDVGREGEFQFKKQDPAAQAKAVRDQYFTIIDRAVRFGVSLFITTNLPLAALPTHFGDAAWERIESRTASRHMIEIDGLPKFRKIQQAMLDREG